VVFSVDLRPDAFGKHPWAQVVTLRDYATVLAPVGGPDGSVVLGYTAAADAEPADHVVYLVAEAGQVPDVADVEYVGAAAPQGMGVLQVWVVAASDEALADVAPRS